MKLTKKELLQKLKALALISAIRSGNAIELAKDYEKQGQDFLEGYYSGIAGAYDFIKDEIKEFLKEEK